MRYCARRLNGRLEYFGAVLVPDRDVVAGPGEGRALPANPMGDILSVILRFPRRPALMSQDVTGRKLSGQIKEKVLHRRLTHAGV